MKKTYEEIREEQINLIAKDSATFLCFEEFQKQIILLLMRKSYTSGHFDGYSKCVDEHLTDTNL